ncbi:10964_t:CDS:1, partial [Funneliformis mosseae]
FRIPLVREFRIPLVREWVVCIPPLESRKLLGVRHILWERVRLRHLV